MKEAMQGSISRQTTASGEANDVERPVGSPAGSAASARSRDVRAGSEIEVRVLFFAQAREAAGVRETTLRIPERASVGEAADLLAAAHLALAPHLERSSFAINERYARREDGLEAGDELAVIPPIGGG